MTQSNPKPKPSGKGVFDESTEALLFKIHFEINGISKVIQDALGGLEETSSGAQKREIESALGLIQKKQTQPGAVTADKAKSQQSLAIRGNRPELESTHPIFGNVARY